LKTIDSDARLRLVEVEQPRQQQRADRNRRGDRMSLLAQQIPEHHRTGRRDEVEVELLRAFDDLRVVAAGLAEPREIALHVGEEDGHADAAELLGEHAQAHGLARAGRARDQSVPVGHARDQLDDVLALGDWQRGGGLMWLSVWRH
jgi:hypothetical protein